MPMTLVVTRNVPARFRGFLASAMCELAPGVYTAPAMSAGVRDRVWAVLVDWFDATRGTGDESIVMTWPDDSEPGRQALRIVGAPRQELVAHDGLYLARRGDREEAAEIADPEAVEAWATALVESDNWRVLDFETTGLGEDAEVVAAAIVDPAGEVTLDTLTRPIGRITADARRVHRISRSSLSRAPRFPGVLRELERAVGDRTVVAWNAPFDRRVLAQTCNRHGLRAPRWRWRCALRAYQGWRGLAAKLGAACEIEGIPVEAAHTASGDALLTWRLVKRMAGETGDDSVPDDP